MVIFVVDDAELTWGDTVDLLLGMDNELASIGPFERGRMVFWRVTNLEGDIRRHQFHREEMEIMHREVLLIGCLGVVAMRDVEDVLRHILLHHEPGATTEAHALALTDSVEPESTVLTYPLARLEFDDVARLLT